MKKLKNQSFILKVCEGGVIQVSVYQISSEPINFSCPKSRVSEFASFLKSLELGTLLELKVSCNKTNTEKEQ